MHTLFHEREKLKEFVPDRKRNVPYSIVWKDHPRYIAPWPLHDGKGRKK